MMQNAARAVIRAWAPTTAKAALKMQGFFFLPNELCFLGALIHSRWRIILGLAHGHAEMAAPRTAFTYINEIRTSL